MNYGIKLHHLLEIGSQCPEPLGCLTLIYQICSRHDIADILLTLAVNTNRST